MAPVWKISSGSLEIDGRLATSPPRLSLAEGYMARVGGIRYCPAGALADPRSVFTPQFQLISPEATTLGGTWATGTWDTNPASNGPYSATVLLGAGGAAPVAPGVAGLYKLLCRMFAASGATPVFSLWTVILEAP